MIIHIASAQLIVLETESCDLIDGKQSQEIVRSVLEDRGLEQWSSIEIEEFTYCDQQLLFATPIKIFIPSFLARLLD